MANVEDNPDLIYVLLPEGTTDPEEAVRRVVVPQLFSSCGFVTVPLDPAVLQEQVARRVHKQCKLMGLRATEVDKAQGLYHLEGPDSSGVQVSKIVYIRPMWINRNPESEQVH